MKVRILEHAEHQGGVHVIASGKSIAIVCSKVSAVISGGKMSTESDGGEEAYCTVVMDSGQEHLVCGDADRVLGWMGHFAD